MSCPRCGNSRVGIIIIIIIRIFKHKKLLLIFRTLHARTRVSLVSWEGRSHALLFMVPLGLPSARPMAQAYGYIPLIFQLSINNYINIGGSGGVRYIIIRI